MIYAPGKKKDAGNMSLLFLITGLALSLISAFLRMTSVIQICAFALIIAGIQLAVRYVLCDYRYIIDDHDDGTADLVVCKRQGKNDVKVCHVSLSCVTDVFKSGEPDIKGTVRYNYTQNLRAESYSVIYGDGEKRVCVMLECSAEFAEALKCRIGIGDGEGTRFSM